MEQTLINDVVQGMIPFLDNGQLQELQKVLKTALIGKTISEIEAKPQVKIKGENANMVNLFISAKRIEGCSEKSLNYYSNTINILLNKLGKDIKKITTEDLRNYLTEYQNSKNLSKVTIDNVRRILSSFFSWLEDEDYILKSPVRRIHKVKTTSSIKETYSDEALERMRDDCNELRDLAMIFLSNFCRNGQ